MQTLPDELAEVMRGLPDTWKIHGLKDWQTGWYAGVSVGPQQFTLVAGRGYISVFEMVSGKPREVTPPEDQRATITPEQVRTLLLRVTAGPPSATQS